MAHSRKRGRYAAEASLADRKVRETVEQQGGFAIERCAS